MNKTTFIGIAGGTGSGKTTVAKKLKKYLSGRLESTIIQQDSYYIDRRDVPVNKRDNINYDHPNSIDSDLIIKHLSRIKNGHNIKIPHYDFINHTRGEDYNKVDIRDIIIFEGILLFHWKEIRDYFDYKIFVDTPDDIRILRRIDRDMKHRGRSFDDVKEQYNKTVRPMHIEFVEPTKKFADIIVPEGGHNKIAVEMIGQSILNKFSIVNE